MCRAYFKQIEKNLQIITALELCCFGEIEDCILFVECVCRDVYVSRCLIMYTCLFPYIIISVCVYIYIYPIYIYIFIQKWYVPCVFACLLCVKILSTYLLSRCCVWRIASTLARTYVTLVRRVGTRTHTMYWLVFQSSTTPLNSGSLKAIPPSSYLMTCDGKGFVLSNFLGTCG